MYRVAMMVLPAGNSAIVGAHPGAKLCALARVTAGLPVADDVESVPVFDHSCNSANTPRGACPFRIHVPADRIPHGAIGFPSEPVAVQHCSDMYDFSGEEMEFMSEREFLRLSY